MPFVQLQKNTTYHRGIHQTPYEALFGKKCEIGIQNSRIPKELWDKISTEEELEEALADASVEKNVDLNNSYNEDEPSEEQQNQAVDNAVDLTTAEENVVVIV